MPPMRFPDRLRLPFAFDRYLLAADLRRLQATPWIGHFVTQNYQGDWSVIPLRGPAGARHPVLFRPDRHRVRGHADAGGLSLFCSVLDSFVCPLQAVGLMRLTPGSVIKEHHDHDLSFEQGMVRIHIPVVTNEGVDFRLNGARVAMPAGSSWYLRLSDPHSVATRGAADRVHLVIDAGVNDWVAALFERATRSQAA